ncbi:MAG TPA: LysR family transcriptional regulator [Solirubrobacteraceae bacterium]|nr:LysR family transcriptional regulator [Solirubrobacteraceae bacterium]
MPFKRGQLRYFVVVADEGQITSAARRLHIAQPALSQAIAQLESDVGFKLLRRHARGVSLTPAGATFYEKARIAVAADEDASQTARWLAREQTDTIEIGFVGAPPGLDSPGLLESFVAEHPNLELRFHELAFPSRPVSDWLAGVDLAVCHRPPVEPGVWVEVLRYEPRAALVPAALSGKPRENATAGELIDETFVGFADSVAPDWAGFWTLDDVRGGPPLALTGDAVTNAQEVLAAISVRRAITTVPASVAELILNGQRDVIAALALTDCEPAAIALAGLEARRTPLVDAIVDFARAAFADLR